MAINIAFFGTSNRSEPILENLYQNFNLNLCVTKTDRIVGRHQERKETLVKSWAKEKGIDFFEIEKIKTAEKNLLEELSKHDIDLIIVADFGFIITSKIIKRFQDKIINIHFSLLPKYRGANPVQAAIIKGEEKTGITFFLMDEGMDTGPILAQIPYELSKKETTETLYANLFEKAAKNLPEVINNYLENKITPKKQKDENATYYYSPSRPKSTYIYKEDAKINWNEKIELIERKIRGFNPWPIAWTTLKELEENPKIEKIKLRDGVNKNLRIKIFEANIKNENLLPKKVQVAGKSQVSWENFKNGYTKKID